MAVGPGRAKLGKGRWGGDWTCRVGGASEAAAAVDGAVVVDVGGGAAEVDGAVEVDMVGAVVAVGDRIAAAAATAAAASKWNKMHLTFC